MCDNLKILGDYNCDTKIELEDVFGYLDLYVASEATGNSNNYANHLNDVFNYLDLYVRLQASEEENTERTSLLQSIKNGSYTPASCTIDGCTGSAPSQDDSNTRQQAIDILVNVNTSENLAIINVPKTDGTGFDIFFKGPEVLEYQVTFSGDIDDSIKTDENLNILTDENRNIFHNLFTANWITNNPHHVEQAFVIDGSKVYQARRSNADEVNTESMPWSDTDLIHMFSTNTNRKINRVDKVRYATDTDLTNNNIIETNAGLIPVLPLEQ
tara:strand:- start:478 stop:1287 length:810 start_codon:yes stop_codon:yes gene_type:complete